jgi:precorrin-6A/cobalt-precorrin-6A reductase
MRERIWLIGGTQESAQLAAAIARQGWLCTVTVTTETARSLYPSAPNLLVWIGQLTPTTITDFLQTEHIGLILDASHPYAVDISKLAIAAAQQSDIPYLRYERPIVNAQNLGRTSIQTFQDVNDLLSGHILNQQRVLLTIGYRPLPQFRDWQDRAILFARIMPSLVALSTAISAGFTPDRLIAMRPPFSVEVEAALWKQWEISMVVAKASGEAGGESLKQRVADALGVKLIILKRPLVHYPQQTSNLAAAIQFCKQQCQLQNT